MDPHFFRVCSVVVPEWAKSTVVEEDIGLLGLFPKPLYYSPAFMEHLNATMYSYLGDPFSRKSFPINKYIYSPEVDLLIEYVYFVEIDLSFLDSLR